VRERERGHVEQLNVTPLRRWEIIVGNSCRTRSSGMIDVVLVIGVTGLLGSRCRCGGSVCPVRDAAV